MSQSSTSPRKLSDREIERAASHWIGRRDAGMTPAEQTEFEAWRRADPRHERALARHEATWRMFDRPAVAGQAEELAAALAASRQRRRSRRRAALGAYIVFAAALGVVWQRGRESAEATQIADVRSGGAVVVMPEKKSLPDGSRVELKPGAELAVDFSGELRRVEMKRGEALFHVVKDPSRPFVVTAAGVAVRAVGTAFSVQFERDEVGVLVTEGRVAVEKAPASPAPVPARDDVERASGAATEPVANASNLPASATPAGEAAVHLEAGQRTVVAPATGPAPQVETLSPAELAARLAWRSPRLEFTATPLQEAIALFNRHGIESGAPRLVIEPADASLAQLEVSGYFRANNVPAFLHLISQTLGVTAEPQGDRIALRRAR